MADDSSSGELLAGIAAGIGLIVGVILVVWFALQMWQGYAAENDALQKRLRSDCTYSCVLREALWAIAWKASFLATAYAAWSCEPWLACVPFNLWTVCRLCFALTPEERPVVLKLVGIAVPLGWALDTLLAVQPWLPIRVIECARMPFGPDPLWMVSLWVGYSAAVDWTQPIFKGWWLSCFILGAIFGPLAYLLGREIGCIIFSDWAALLVAIEHGASFSLFTYLSTHFRRGLVPAPVGGDAFLMQGAALAQQQST